VNPYCIQGQLAHQKPTLPHTRAVSWSSQSLRAVNQSKANPIGHKSGHLVKPTLTIYTRAVSRSKANLTAHNSGQLVKPTLTTYKGGQLVKSHLTQEWSVGQANPYRIQGWSAGQKQTLLNTRAVSWSWLQESVGHNAKRVPNKRVAG